MQTKFAIIVPIMVLTIIVMGLVVIPASAASSTSQTTTSMLQQRRGASAVSPGGHSQAAAVPGSGASAGAGCTRLPQPPQNFAFASPCGTLASALVGRQVEREQSAAAPSAR
jgi:hypothetical protein